MLQKILAPLYSTRLMAVLFIVFAAAMAAGTFIEDAYNTETARIIIYNSWWFELIMAFFVINFFGNIYRYQLHKKEKWATLLLHLSFIFILLGAFVTRYISFEGMMLVREGGTSNVVYSDMPYITAFVDGKYQGEMKRKTVQKQALFSKAVSNSFSISDNFDGEPFTIELQDFILNAKQTFKPNVSGKLYLKLVEASQGGRKEHYLVEGEVKMINNLLFAFNKQTEGAINILKDGDQFQLQTPFDGNFMRMADKMQGTVTKNTTSPVMFRSLYNMGGIQFVLPEIPSKGELALISDDNYKDKSTDDAVRLKVSSQGKEEVITLFGQKGKQSEPKSFNLGKLEFTLFYGSKVYETPFSIKLEDFIAEKYPGTEKSYSAFKSKLEIQDTQERKTFKDSVFMNHILDYRGYRFFQAGFDPDEQGTHLSVNHDFWGTWLTYIGYFLLYIGLMAILFDKNTRFNDLTKKLDKIKAKKSALTLLFFFFAFSGFAQDNHDEHNHEEHNHEGHVHETHEETSKNEERNKSVTSFKMPTASEALAEIKKYIVSPEQAEKFGRLVIQDAGGRMKPINTFSSELIRKVYKNDHFEDLTSDQVLISMTQYPQLWVHVPTIYLKRGNDSIRSILGVPKDTKYVSLFQFFDASGNYKIEKQVDEAYKEAQANQFQKDFMDLDKKVHLLNDALSGSILKIFPIPNDKQNKWLSYMELGHKTNTPLDFVKQALPLYLNELVKASQSKDYKLADQLLSGIVNYQKKFGSKVMLSEDKINAEVIYNKYDIFKKLFSWYMYASVLMFLFVIWKIFSDKKWVKITVNVIHVIIGILFALHVSGLIARWYISGHAPWSDAYESLIYVAWATMFFGLALGRKSQLTVAATTFATSIILMVAHWSWMDPAIANLQPVLNSYWLMIHVAVIVMSYGPFTVGMILGLVALFLFIFTNENNKEKMNLNIQEITYINEMALTIGLVLLTIGNFLGGQWANESWGRYWGWDPKETWALISIMIYAFVIHARFVPALRGKWIYNVMSVFAFASILMTYFGVNFHLSGMHSYASGEKQNAIYYLYAVIVVSIIAALAYWKYRKHYKK